MKFVLEGLLELSKPIDFLKLDFPKIIATEINAGIFKKGVPTGQEGSRIVGWNISGARFVVTIEGTTYLRPHDALLRLRNYITENFGKDYNVGVRKIYVKSYLIEIETNATENKVRELVGNFAQVKMKGKILSLIFENLEERDLEQRLVENVLKEIEKIVPVEAAKGNLAHFGHILKKTKVKTPRFNKDVAEVAQKLGWIKRFPGRGQWILLPPAAKILYTFKDMIIDNILKPLKFEEYMFPKLISFEVMKKMPGYFEHLSEGMFYVTNPSRDPMKFEEFKRHALLKKEVRGDLLKKILDEPEYVLAPAQCEPFYQLFSGEIVRAQDLPIKAIDASGWTWRAEGGGVEGLVRTTEFWRMEAVWLGLPEQVSELRDKMAELTFNMVDKVLDLEARVTAGAPFYAVGEEMDFVDVSKTENIPALDVEVFLPNRGERDRSEWLEISAHNCHKSKYVDSFNIKEASGKDIWTGCTGFGLTRWLSGFLAQKGFEFDNWPLEIKKKIKKIPSTAKMVSWP